MYKIYKVTNTVNKKVYFGMTSRDTELRWKSHLSAARNGSAFRFHSAIRKHGEDVWDVITLFEGLSEIEARKIEENLIREYGAMDNQVGYNAKPGGCGGWIVPEDKIAQWKIQISKQSSGTNNPNYCNMSDEKILEIVHGYYERNKHKFSIRRALIDCHAEFGTPLHLKDDFRFIEFGGGKKGLRAALAKKLGIDKELLEYSKSDVHKDRLRSSVMGFRWYTNTETNETIQVKGDFEKYDNDTKWKRGRKK